MQQIKIRDIINDYIKMRGRTRIEIADMIGIDYKTFSGHLNRNAFKAEELLKLASVLEIDLNWMSEIICPSDRVSRISARRIQRMSSDYRDMMRPGVIAAMDLLINENPMSVSEVRKGLRRYYNTFFLLDVLLPKDQQICIQVDRRGNEQYLIPDDQVSIQGRQQMIVPLIDANEALDRIIYERMVEK